VKKIAGALAGLLALLLVVEGMLRVAGFAPLSRLNRFHARLGWEKTPGLVSRRKTSEFDVTFTINEKGLRGPLFPEAKPPGTTRLVFAGDSFCLGYTVEEGDLFVEILGRELRAEGRPVEVVNGGTEGYSTDQEALWMEEVGVRYSPDVAFLCFYQNDVFHCGRDRYLRYPKLLLDAEGNPTNLPLVDPGSESWVARKSAIGNVIGKWTAQPGPRLSPPDSPRAMPAEFGVVLRRVPQEISSAWERVRGAVRLFARVSREAGARPIALVLPDKIQVHPEARSRFERAFGLDEATYDADLPTATFAALAREEGLEVLEPLGPLRAAASAGESLYFEKDWHFSPQGNRVVARFLRGELDRLGLLPAPTRPATPLDPPAPESSFPWILAFLAAVWVALSVGYLVSYRDEPAWIAPLKTALFLGLVAAIFWTATNWVPRWIGLLAVLAILGFVVAKTARRLDSVLELLVAFARRGHWYVLPLLGVLVSIGTLLVVAATSPFVAPFIYTLF
jgi:hypothetical protein